LRFGVGAVGTATEAMLTAAAATAGVLVPAINLTDGVVLDRALMVGDGRTVMPG